MKKDKSNSLCQSEMNEIKIYISYNKIIDFSNYSNEFINELIIPEGIKEIGKSSFENCINLVKLKLPESINVLKERCFYNCKSLKCLYIPKNLYLINEEAFNECKSLYLLVVNNTYFKTENRFTNTNISVFINDNNVIYLNSDFFDIVTNNCNFLINQIMKNDLYNYIRINNDKVDVNGSSITIFSNQFTQHSLISIEKGKLLYKKRINLNLYE